MPNLICLDEPTSGLDSHSAEIVISTLKRVARSHPLTIITSIHQPTTFILNQFDQLYVLARGGICIFNGHPNGLCDFVAQVPELINNAPNNSSPIEMLIRQSCASCWQNELTTKLNQLVPNIEKLNEVFEDTYLSVDGVMANQTRFTIHSFLQLSRRYLMYIYTYLYKEWLIYIFINILSGVTLRLLLNREMIHISSCVNIEQDDLSSCQMSLKKLNDKLMLIDNSVYLYYAFVTFLFLPLVYSAVSLLNELPVMANEHRNGKIVYNLIF